MKKRLASSLCFLLSLSGCAKEIALSVENNTDQKLQISVPLGNAMRSETLFPHERKQILIRAATPRIEVKVADGRNLAYEIPDPYAFRDCVMSTAGRTLIPVSIEKDAEVFVVNFVENQPSVKVVPQPKGFPLYPSIK